MVENLFLELVNMSISASWFILAIILFCFVFKRLPKFFNCILWGLAAIRLACPITFKASFSLIPSNATVTQEIFYAKNPALNTGVSAIDKLVNPIVSGSLSPDPMTSANPAQIYGFIAANLWVFGIAVMLIYGIVSFVRLKIRVRTSVLSDGVYLCDNIDTPFILGIFKPRIYLPSDIKEGGEYIIAHEIAHIKRLDHIWKPIGFLVLSVHWFNPLVWLAYGLFCKDLELACDEKIIKSASVEYKKEYSAILLACSTKRRFLAACPIAFGEVGVKMRIKKILSYKKPAFWIIGFGVVALVVLAACFLTNPKGVSITDIDDHGPTIQTLNNVDTVEVISPATISMVYDESDIIEKLKKLEVKKKPVSQSRDEDRDKTYRLKLNGEFDINFSSDFKTVWFNNYVKPTFSYKVLNPEILKGIFDTTNPPKHEPEVEEEEDTVFYFDAVINEIDGSGILVEPDDKKISDIIWVGISDLPDEERSALNVGDRVRIAYNGSILEIYPPILEKLYGIEVLE